MGNETQPTTTITVSPGSQTSEFTLTKYVAIFGGVLTLLFGVLTQVQQSGLLPDDSKVMHIVAAILAGVSMLLTFAHALGYTNARASVKNSTNLANASIAASAARLVSGDRIDTGAGTTAPQATAGGAPSSPGPQ